MIDFNDLTIHRTIYHTILAKTRHTETSTTELNSSLIAINESVSTIIKERLNQAAGKESKSFELMINNTSDDSFLGYSKDIRTNSDQEFIESSQELANLLAESQTRSVINTGYLVVLDCSNNETNLPITIVIKADPHKALTTKRTDTGPSLELLENVILSPTQRLFKIGILETISNGENLPEHQRFKGYLFDDQFRADSKPAEYFYKDFLGFEISSNAKVLTQKFYDITRKFIEDLNVGFEIKSQYLSALKSELANNADTISPIDFANLNFSRDVADEYRFSVSESLPSTFAKNISLIKTIFKTRKITFPDSIKIQSPEESFGENIKIIDSIDELQALTTDTTEYTIIRINGKPFQDD